MRTLTKSTGAPLLIQSRGQKKKKEGWRREISEISYCPLDLNEEMGGLIYKEKRICTKIAYELSL